MEVIMENFRHFRKEIKKHAGEHDNKVYLFESRSRSPSSTIDMDTLREQVKTGHITEEESWEIWNRSFDYELKRIDEAVGDVVGGEEGEEEEVQPFELPAPLEAAAKLFEKGIDWISDKIKSAGRAVLIGLAKLYNVLKRFKEKHPVLFWIGASLIVALIALAIMWLVNRFMAAIQDHPNYEPGQAFELCPPGGALQEQGIGGGTCLDLGGKALDQDTYDTLQGALIDIQKSAAAEGGVAMSDIDPKMAGTLSEAAGKARVSLQACYEGTAPGIESNALIQSLEDGGQESGTALFTAIRNVEALTQSAADELERYGDVAARGAPFTDTRKLQDLLASGQEAAQIANDQAKILGRTAGGIGTKAFGQAGGRGISAAALDLAKK